MGLLTLTLPALKWGVSALRLADDAGTAVGFIAVVVLLICSDQSKFLWTIRCSQSIKFRLFIYWYNKTTKKVRGIFQKKKNVCVCVCCV
jgi:hypothetical protein